MTNAGGPGIVATDMTMFSGLELAKFKDETVETLASHLPSTANLRNPVDVIGDATTERYENALGAVIRDAGVDGALVILTPQSMTDVLGTAEAIARIARKSFKPILCCFMGVIDVSAGVRYLQDHGIPVYKFPENAAKAFGALYRYSNWLNCGTRRQYPLKLRPRAGGPDHPEVPGVWQDAAGRARWHRGARSLRVQGAAGPSWPRPPRRRVAADAAKMAFPAATVRSSPSRSCRVRRGRGDPAWHREC